MNSSELGSAAEPAPILADVCVELESWDDVTRGAVVREYVDTPHGHIQVAVQGDREQPAILTYHDIALNHGSNFNSFLSDRSMSPLVSQFCWYHVDAPGQERNATNLPEEYIYPTMTQLAEQIEFIADHFLLSYFIGLGVGAGANVLARYAAINPERVQGLVLLNLSPSSMSWTNLSRITGMAVSWQLRGRSEGLTRLASNHFIRQAFGPSSEDVDSVLVKVYEELVDNQNPHNLALFLDSYYKRSSISMDLARNMKCRCLFIVSSNFYHTEEVEKLCSAMDTQKTTFLEVSNTSGLILDDQPTKISKALRLFVQGLGLAPSISSKSLPLKAEETKEMALFGLPAQLHNT